MTSVPHSGAKSVTPGCSVAGGAGHTGKFRDELAKIMPGYQWTTHRPLSKTGAYLEATGIQSSGFNRLSTLAVTRRERDGVVEYEVKSAGFGKRAPWLHTNRDSTLARALRGLQQHYETMASTYHGHASALQSARSIAKATAGETRNAEGAL